MNRILTLSAIAFAVTLSSCMKLKNDEVSPIRGGLEIYSVTSESNTLSLDPTNIAVRLNILMYEAANAVPEITDLNEVKVPEPGEPAPDTEPKMFNVKTALFGDATISESVETPGTYSIVYSPYFKPTGDRERHGKITIATGGKSLYEEGSAWVVLTPNPSEPSEDAKPYLSLSNPYGAPTKLYYNWSYYDITGSVTGQIHVETNFTGYVDDKNKINWDLYADIALPATQGFFTYKDAATTVSMTCEGDGGILGGPTNPGGDAMVFYYEVEDPNPLVFSPSCGWAFIKSGKVTSAFPNGPIFNPERYPRSSVVVQFVEGGSCRTEIDVTYNGITKRLE